MSQRPFRFAVQSFSASSASEWRERARKVESLGYSALHLADHVLGPGEAIASTGHPVQELAAVPAMAMAAEATSTLRIGCRVFCIDYRQPAVLAKEAATLDLLSEGRLELGLGAGWLRAEYEALGIPFDRPGVRIARLEEVVAFIKAHMSGEPLKMEGEHLRIHGYSGVPKPVQEPHPAILIGGGGKRVLSLAAREADIVSFNFNNQSGVLGPEAVQSGSADATEEKVAWVKAAAGDRFDSLQLEIGLYFGVIGDAASAAAEGMAKAMGMSASDLRSHPHAIFGSADEAIEELSRRRERYGIHYFTVAEPMIDAFAPVVAALAGR